MPEVDAGSEAVQRLDSLYEFERAPVTEDRLDYLAWICAGVMGAAVTLVYFVAGTIWMNENEKRRTQGAR